MISLDNLEKYSKYLIIFLPMIMFIFLPFHILQLIQSVRMYHFDLLVLFLQL